MFSWVLRLSFLSIHLITHIEHNVGFQVVKNVCGSSRVNCAKLTIFSTLNDEGDFLIAGINDNNHDETPSLSLKGNLQFSSQFSGEVGEVPQQQNKGSILGLDDYGDFPLNIPSAEEEGTFYSLGMQSMMAARNNDNSNEVSILPTTTCVKEKQIIMDNIESSGNKDSKMEEFESSEKEIEALEGFLTSFFSTMNPKVLRTYAKGLERLGFDPDCESSKELEFEDLRFMKNLHQRYFWKEWEKLTKNVE